MKFITLSSCFITVVKPEDGGVITEAEFMRNCEALDVNVDLLVSMKSVR